MKKNKLNLILSPLAGVTDKAFRSICNDYSLDYAYTEMVSAKGLLYSDKVSEELLARFEGEENIGVQIFGSDPEILAEIAGKINQTRPYFKSVDINMGCPAKKIVKNGEGSALMKNPELIKKIVYSVKNAIDLPLSVKFRLGFDDDSINYLEVGKICQAQGASLVTLHARTREQMYSGKADWDAIKNLREELSIPVVGNGDVFSPEDAIKMAKYTGVDSIAIGRGAMGNPFIFKQIKDYISTGSYETIGIDEVIDTIIKHFNLLISFKGERIAVNEMRKHIAWYIKGFRGSNQLKNKINLTKDMDQVLKYLEEFREEIKADAKR